MRVRIRKWGNSLALRIPRGCVAEACVTDGSEVDVTVRCGDIVVAPVRAPAYRLDDLVRAIRPSNLHVEEQAGPSVGREAW